MGDISVPLKERSYSIAVGRGKSAANARLKAILEESTRVFLLTNRTVWRIYSGEMRRRDRATAGAIPLLMPDGERYKNLNWYERLCRELILRGADRHSCLLALGGGVVGDLAGFVAATVLRGIRLVHLPTTLLAQIDSSIGGKAGVNLPEGKNLVGTFYQPSLVIADPEFLRTLPRREFRAGVYEAIKYGIILDAQLFAVLESRMKSVLECDLEIVEEIIHRCVSAKAAVVGEDERESGIRKLLNFGHTVGHGLESMTFYRRFRHGEAVGWGSLVAVRVGERLGTISSQEALRLRACILSAGRLPRITDLSAAVLLRHMCRDKKSVAGNLQFILPTGIGSAKVVDRIDLKLVKRSFLEVQNEAR